MRLPLTQRELAEPLGLTQQALSLKLKGRQVIRAEELRTLALFFDIPMEVFFLPPDEVVRSTAPGRSRRSEPSSCLASVPSPRRNGR